ncbi:hypothetical protein, partial [Pseudomonas syringae]
PHFLLGGVCGADTFFPAASEKQRETQRPFLAVCCLSPRQPSADSCLFCTEGMIDNVRVQEVYHSVCGSELLADRLRTGI